MGRDEYKLEACDASLCEGESVEIARRNVTPALDDEAMGSLLMRSLIQIKDAAAGAIILRIYIEEAMAEELQSLFQCKMRTLLGFLPHPGASASFSLSLFIVIDLHERRRVTAFVPRIIR